MIMCNIYIFFLRDSCRQVVHNTEAHIRIMEMLLLHCDWNERLPEFASAPQLPPRKVSRPQYPVFDAAPIIENEAPPATDRTAAAADCSIKEQSPATFR